MQQLGWSEGLNVQRALHLRRTGGRAGSLNARRQDQLRGSLNSRCQRGPNHPCEIGAEVRLRQQQHTGVEPPVVQIGILVRRSMEPTGRGASSNIGQLIPTVGGPSY
jgi:hypothetical protein